MLVQSTSPILSRRLLAFLLTAAVGLVVLSAAPAAHAATRSEFVVDTLEDRGEEGSNEECAEEDHCSLREALEVVAEGEVAAGDVKILIQVPNPQGTKQTLELTGGQLEAIAGPAVDSIKIVGPGAELFAIDAQGATRVLVVEGDVSLSGLTIEGGHTDGGGGGIIVETGGLGLEDVDLVENHADESGGGLLAEAGAVTIEGGKFLDNSSPDEGGAIAATSGKVEIDRTQLLDNEAESGGALAASDEAEVVLTRALLEENAATKSGGAIVTSAKSLLVKESEITGNEAVKYGGAIYLLGPATIEASTVNGNFVPEPSENGEGGTITARDDGTLEMVNSTVAYNRGTAVYGDGLAVRESTIVDNVGNFAVGGLKGTGLTVASSVVFGNVSDHTGQENCQGRVSAGRDNYVGMEECEWGEEGSMLDQTGSPELGALDYYGGATKTMPPVSRWSPLINAGSEPAATDQRGEPRPIPDNPEFTDIGAVEVQAPTLDAAPVLVAPEGMGVGEMLECQTAKGKSDTVDDPGYSVGWHVGDDPVSGEGDFLWVEASFAGKPITCEETIDSGVATDSRTSNALELAPAKPVASPTSIAFGDVLVGDPTEPRQIELKDSGETGFEVYAVTIDSTEYELDADDCPPGRQVPERPCAVSVKFHPTTAGSHPAEIKFETSAGDATVELTGTGAEPELTLSTSELDFGGVEVGDASSTLTVTGTNTGDATLTIYGATIEGNDEFEEVSNGCAFTEIEPGEDCEVEVRFSPLGAGEKTAHLKFISHPEREVLLKGTGLQAGFSATPDPFNFGDQAKGTSSAARGFTITNSGTAPLEIGTVQMGGADAGDFPLGVDECEGHTVAVGDSCEVEVWFHPSGVGSAAAQIEFATNIGGEVKTIALSGTGTGPEFGASPASVDFGEVRLDSTAGPQTVLVENAGNEEMTVGALGLEGADAAAFAIAPVDTCEGVVLQPGDECEVGVEFSPTAIRAYAATLKVGGSAPGTVALGGSGAEGQLSVTPTSADFGPVALGAEAQEEFVVENLGSVAVDIGAIDLAGAAPGSFWIDDEDCDHRLLEPDDLCGINIGFVPKALGSLTALVEFEGSAVQIGLAGTGVAPKLEVEPGAVDFGGVAVGAVSATASVRVMNGGDAPATIDAPALVGSGAAQFRFPAEGGCGGAEPASGEGCCAGATLAPGEGCTLKVAFAPSAAGAAAAEVVVTAGLDSVAVPLSGTGIAATPEPTPPAVTEPGPAPAPTPPTAALRPPRGPLTVGGSGTLGVALTCSAPVGSSCPLKVTLVPAGKAAKLPKRLGAWSGSVAGGASRTVKVPLGKAGKAALADAGKLRVVLVLSWGTGEERIPVVIRAPRRTKH